MREKPRVIVTIVLGDRKVGVSVITGFSTIDSSGSMSFEKAVEFLHRVNNLRPKKNGNWKDIFALATEYGLRPPLR